MYFPSVDSEAAASALFDRSYAYVANPTGQAPHLDQASKDSASGMGRQNFVRLESVKGVLPIYSVISNFN